MMRETDGHGGAEVGDLGTGRCEETGDEGGAFGSQLLLPGVDRHQ